MAVPLRATGPPPEAHLKDERKIDEFMLWPIQDVARIVRDTQQFKLSCSLGIIDVLVRHGHIEAEHPDYVAICQGLRR